MGAIRNKSAGSNYEREIVNRLKATGFFPNVYTSRLASRLRDSQKIDICNGNEDEFGRLQYNIQTKTIMNQPQYHQVLGELPQVEGVLNVFLHKKTEKRGTRFFTTGNYAFMTEDDFFRLAIDRERYRVGFEILNEFFDSIDDEYKPDVHRQLTELGL